MQPQHLSAGAWRLAALGGLSLALMCRSATTDAQVAGPFPMADYFSYPVSAAWDCNSDPAKDDRCAQHVGDYYSIPNDSLSPDPTVTKHSLCGKHLADDISVPAGTIVTDIADGVVRFSQPVDKLGYVVNIEHKLPNGTYVTSVYMHMKRVNALTPDQVARLPRVGSLIRRGDFVGVVTDVDADNFKHQHLHFGIRKEGTMGYKGSAAVDGRTLAHYYVGYSTFFYSDGTRRCDDASVGGIAADRINPTHNNIVADWEASPHAFIASHIPPPVAAPTTYQPGNDVGVQDIWTTSVFSYAPSGGGPGGGLNDDRLRVGGWGDLYYSLIQFDLANLPHTASSAKIELYMPQVTGGGATRVAVYKINTSWDWRVQGTGSDRDRLWWADKPLTDATPFATLLPAAGTWLSIDITVLYNAWQSGTQNYGIELRPVNGGDNTWAEFASSNHPDSTLRPRLVIAAENVTPALPTLESQTDAGTLDSSNCNADRFGGSCAPFVGGKYHREDLIATKNWSVTTSDTLYATFYLGMDGASWGSFVTDPPQGIQVQVSSGISPSKCQWFGYLNSSQTNAAKASSLSNPVLIHDVPLRSEHCDRSPSTGDSFSILWGGGNINGEMSSFTDGSGESTRDYFVLTKDVPLQ